tara:strand:+ start:828 stop:1160 length:333 start_codon:yes stop_codon:yes gene_type:complete
VKKNEAHQRSSLCSSLFFIINNNFIFVGDIMKRHRTKNDYIMEKMLEVIPNLEQEFTSRQMRDVLVSHRVRYVGSVNYIARVLRLHPSFKPITTPKRGEKIIYRYAGEEE